MKNSETLALISVKNITSGGPGDFKFNQNYPNPFNPLVKTHYVGRKDAGTYYEVFGGNGYRAEFIIVI